MICEEAICDFCIYQLKVNNEITGCGKEPKNKLRDELAKNHHYCTYFKCRYKEHGLCKKEDGK